MTTPGLPPTPVTAPASIPHAGGLHGAAIILDRTNPYRLAGGIELKAVDQGAHGLWPAGCPPEGHNESKGGAHCPDLTVFPTTVVWAADDRSLVGQSGDDARLAAAHTLTVTEQVDTEEHAAGLLVEHAGTPATADGTGGDALVAALGAVEAALLSTGVVHAPRGVAALAASKNLIVERSGRLYTPLGNRWAFGVGYAEKLAGMLVATGPVTITRGPVETSTAVDTRNNHRLVVSERHVVVTWTGPTIAAQF